MNTQNFTKMNHATLRMRCKLHIRGTFATALATVHRLQAKQLWIGHPYLVSLPTLTTQVWILRQLPFLLISVGSSMLHGIPAKHSRWPCLNEGTLIWTWPCVQSRAYSYCGNDTRLFTGLLCSANIYVTLAYAEHYCYVKALLRVKLVQYGVPHIKRQMISFNLDASKKSDFFSQQREQPLRWYKLHVRAQDDSSAINKWG